MAKNEKLIEWYNNQKIISSKKPKKLNIWS